MSSEEVSLAGSLEASPFGSADFASAESWSASFLVLPDSSSFFVSSELDEGVELHQLPEADVPVFFMLVLAGASVAGPQPRTLMEKTSNAGSKNLFIIDFLDGKIRGSLGESSSDRLIEVYT